MLALSRITVKFSLYKLSNGEVSNGASYQLVIRGKICLLLSVGS